MSQDEDFAVERAAAAAAGPSPGRGGHLSLSCAQQAPKAAHSTAGICDALMVQILHLSSKISCLSHLVSLARFAHLSPSVLVMIVASVMQLKGSCLSDGASWILEDSPEGRMALFSLTPLACKCRQKNQGEHRYNWENRCNFENLLGDFTCCACATL